ncbi:MAG TPA: hypothetical protein VMG38_01015 [Trebonia sp.]|nr:hypothetical protein [Trebonia sp.]
MDLKPAEMTDGELAAALKTAAGDRLDELTKERDERQMIRASIRPYVPQQGRRSSTTAEP